MDPEKIDYPAILQDALRDAVRRVLEQVAEDGLPGEHHFFIGFHTGFPGVQVPRFLRDQYPEEVTIILQHQFWGLEVEKNSFSVTLSFNDRHERISIPFEAITSFADPAVKFGLRFEAQDHPASKAAEANTGEPASAAAQSTGSETAQGEGANVVALETFRKK